MYVCIMNTTAGIIKPIKKSYEFMYQTIIMTWKNTSLFHTGHWYLSNTMFHPYGHPHK